MIKKHKLTSIFLFILFIVSIGGCSRKFSKVQSLQNEAKKPGILPREACGVWCWYSTGGAPSKWDGKITAEEIYPDMKGIPIVVGWNELEPEDGVYNWDLVDDIIKQAATHDKYVFTLLWLNPVNAEWLYDKGVPKVEINTFKSDSHFATLPYPMDEKYKYYSERIITKFAEHLRNLPPQLLSRVAFHQVVEGSTGDGFCYKGEPKNPKYNVSQDEWAEYQKYIRKFTINAFTGKESGKPEIPLLIHLMTNGDMTWGAEQYEGFLTKKGVASHFYHSNDTKSKSKIYEPYNTDDNELGRPIYSRGEGETMWGKEWFKKDSLQNLYWSAFHALHWGLDIWNIPSHVLEQPKWYPALDVFNKYAGYKFPAKSPYAFATLKDELNANDTIRFPENVYGKATKKNTDRVLKICDDFADHGAVVEDLDLSLVGSLQSRRREGYNDVAWDRIDTDYRLYLYSIDQAKTSIGWWNVGPKDQPYGRFARGFEHVSGKDALYFKFHDKFFEGKPGKLKVRIIWLDNNDGKWAFAYDTGEADLKIGKIFKGKNTGRWVEEEILIENAVMKNNGPRGSDIALINMDAKDDIFHLVEITRE
ncbi:MAG: beta-galactosidase [Flavobacteriaceae bacterium]|nr:beta-galactosidase [Flavobacteriaceae bacterium]